MLQLWILVAFSNAFVVTLLVAILWAVRRYRPFENRPALVRIICLLALAKLLLPPLVIFPISLSQNDRTTDSSVMQPRNSSNSALLSKPSESDLPILDASSRDIIPSDQTSRSASSPPSQLSDTTDATSTIVVTTPLATDSPSTTTNDAQESQASWGLLVPFALFFTWSIGGLFIAVINSVRWIQFRRLLYSSEPASIELQTEVRSLSKEMAVRCPYRIQLVDSRISPLVLGFFRPWLVLPNQLLKQLPTSERKLLIAHELVHLKQKDHWTRYVELATSVIYWWLPTVKLLQVMLHDSEEQICDWKVTRSNIGTPIEYAAGLVSALEFLANHKPSLPLTTGAVACRTMRQRIESILSGETRGERGWLNPTLITAAVIGMLLISPLTNRSSPSNFASAAEDEKPSTVLVNQSTRHNKRSGSNRSGQDPEPAKDLLGDDIPLGASVRLGSNRLYHYSFNIDRYFDVSPSTHSYVTVDFDSLQVWDSRSGRLRFCFDHPTDSIVDMVVDDAHKSVAVLFQSHDKETKANTLTLRRFDLSSGKLVAEHELLRSTENYYVSRFHLTRDKQRILLVMNNGELLLTDVRQHVDVQKMTTKSRSPISVSQPDSDWVYFSSYPNASVSEATTIWRLNIGAEKAEVEEVKRFDDLQKLAVVGQQVICYPMAADSALRLNKLSDDSPGHTIMLPKVINPASIRLHNNSTDPNSAMLFGVWQENSAAVFARLDLQKSKFIPVYEPESMRGLGGIAGFDETNKRIAFDTRGRYRFIDWTTKLEVLANERADSWPIRDIVFSPDEEFVLTRSEESVKKWKTSNGELLKTFQFNENCSGVALSHDGRRIAISTVTGEHPDFDVLIRLFDADTNGLGQSLAFEMPISTNSWTYRCSIVFSEDDSQLLTYSGDLHLRRWDLASGELVTDAVLKPDDRDIPLVNEGVRTYYHRTTFSSDSQYLMGLAEGFVDCYEVSTLTRVMHHPATFRAACPIPGEPRRVVIQAITKEDGRVVGNPMALVRLGEDAQQLLTGPDEDFGRVEGISSDVTGRYLAFDTSKDRVSRLRIVDLRTNEVKVDFRRSDIYRFYTTAFSPSGKWFAARTGYNDVLLWELDELIEDHSP